MSRDKLWPEGYVEELYVDRLEGELDAELDAELEKELAIWLKSSNAETNEVNALELEKLSQIRQGLKNSDDVSTPESGAYYDALEARIMASLDAAIESGEINDRTVQIEVAAPRGLVAQAAKLKRRKLSIRAGQIVILAGLALLTTGKWLIGPSIEGPSTTGAESSSVANHLRATHQAAPEVLTGTVISFESDADLALEIAARRMAAYHQGE